MNECDESMDIIVLPEACDIPALAKTREESMFSSKKYNEKILTAAKETAKRCCAIVFVNARSYEESENGIVCNVFWSDDLKETNDFLDMGIDVILTNNHHKIATVVNKREKYYL